MSGTVKPSEDGKLWKKILYLVIAVACACATAAFAVMYIQGEDGGFVAAHSTLLTVISVTLLAVLAALTVLFALLGKDFLHKILFVTIIFLFICGGALYALYASGFLDRIDSVEDLREFIAPYGKLSALLFLLLSLLQVVVLPIPGVVSIGAGVLLFGPFKGALLSFLGIMAGSVIAFFIGRCLGYKVASWLVGKENLEKGLQLVKGKDKVILTFMFLFPFFPDDVLCFVSGLSSMSVKFFLIMITVTRLISTFTTAYSVNGSLIPYNTWWGLLIWAMLIIGCLWLVKLVYKNSDKIEKFFKLKK